MHDTARDPDAARSRARLLDGAPWAVALNATAARDNVAVTLLALTLVDDVVHVSGVVRVVGRVNVQLSSIPALGLATLDGPPLGLVRAHGLPGGRLVWITWTYERPTILDRRFEGRIDHIDLAYRAGGRINEAVPGPWVFRFDIPDESTTGDEADQRSSSREA